MKMTSKQDKSMLYICLKNVCDLKPHQYTAINNQGYKTDRNFSWIYKDNISDFFDKNMRIYIFEVSGNLGA